jgi:hypothetical protein
VTNGDDAGYYVYGVIDADAEVESVIATSSAIDPHQPPYIVTAGTVAAVVSIVSLDDFGEADLPERLNEPEWLLPRVAAHEDVLAHALARATVIPFRFGTVYRDAASVEDFLRSHEAELAATLRRLNGRIEIGVKAYVDRDRAAEVARRADTDLSGLEAELADAPEGRAYMLRRRIDRMVEDAVQRREAEWSEASHDALSAAAEESRVNPIRSPTPDEPRSMILNGAYLVASDGDLRQVARDLEEQYGSAGFSVELTGPWPPYNFVEQGRA